MVTGEFYAIFNHFSGLTPKRGPFSKENAQVEKNHVGSIFIEPRGKHVRTPLNIKQFVSMFGTGWGLISFKGHLKKNENNFPWASPLKTGKQGQSKKQLSLTLIYFEQNTTVLQWAH